MTNENTSAIEAHLDQMSELFADFPWKNASAPTRALLDLHRRLGDLALSDNLHLKEGKS